jgi:phosphomannomutase/phosphoglucomutase
MDAKKLSCFKAYDIRGKVPEELNPEIAYLIGREFVTETKAEKVVVGYDIRLESKELAQALTKGITDSGSQVIDIGLCGTEEVYFAVFHKKVGGGIMVTASHNPKGYNGMKLVTEGSKPISGDSGLNSIRDRVGQSLPFTIPNAGSKTNIVIDTDKTEYIDHLLSYVNLPTLKPLKIVMNPGNGSAGPAAHSLAEKLPFQCFFVNDTPDGNFPNGVPNPLLPENRYSTAEAVVKYKADLGIAWDGDFDRCFLFDENGMFIEGYYLVGLLAESILKKHKGSKIIHDPRLIWNTVDLVKSAGGIPVQSKTGHAFIKERMRKEDAIYGGEMSAHHYFKDFAYCDSGMIPWLLIAELMSSSGKKLSELVAERMAVYPCSGELNYTVSDAKKVLEEVIQFFKSDNPKVDNTDGLSLEFSEWRMNIRSSNTEPLLRLNVETRGNVEMVNEKVKLIESIIKKTN